MALDLVSAFTIDEQIQALYITYFDRAAEPAGLAHWRERYETELAEGRSGTEILVDFASAFANVAEARTAFPFLLDPTSGDAQTLVESVYEALFARPPEGQADDATTGFGFWVDRFTQQREDGVPIGDSILRIMSAAQNDDRALIADKIAAADAFTDHLVDRGLAYDQREATSLLERISADMSENQARESVDQDDPNAVTATLDIEADPAFAGRTDEIEGAIRDALDRVLARLEPEPGNVEIRIQATDTSALATGGSTYFQADTGPEGGTPSVFANQLITGLDTNGSTGPEAADVTISLSRQRIDEFDFGDGTGDFSAVNVFAHELFHGLGISSFADSDEDIMTVWDLFLEPESDGSYVFTGPNAVAANGGQPVALDGTAHLSEAEFTKALMTPKAEVGGGEQITDLDVALLADIGLPMSDSYAIA